MIYGLIGASGTGKTTLAKMVADTLSILYQPSSITECAKKHGFDAVGSLSLEKRMELQWHLLNDHVEMIEKTERPMITDRTPVDMAAYAMAEFTMQSHQSASDKILADAESYVSHCLRAAERHFEMLFVLGRLNVYEVSETRPALNPAYQRHTDLIMKRASPFSTTGLTITSQNPSTAKNWSRASTRSFAGPKAIVFICRLRRKLGKHGNCIETVWGRGYLMVDPKETSE